MMSKLSIPEGELVNLIKLRKHIGAEALFDTYAKILSLTIFRIVQDKKKTNDLLEKAFVRIWQTIDLCNEQEKTLVSWLLSVAKELASELQASEVIKLKPNQLAFKIGNVKLA
jgi:hypothetical protein